MTRSAPFRTSQLKSLLTLLSVTSAGTVFALPPSTSAYSTDPQESHVQDQTSEAIGQLNNITCFMSSMKPADMVNKGAYVALVNQNVCDDSKRSNPGASSDQNTGGSNAEASYTRAVVDSCKSLGGFRKK